MKAKVQKKVPAKSYFPTKRENTYEPIEYADRYSEAEQAIDEQIARYGSFSQSN